MPYHPKHGREQKGGYAARRSDGNVYRMQSRYKRENVRNRNPVATEPWSDVPEMKGYVASKFNKYESTAL